MAHELGHWKESHLLKGSVIDTVYMVIFAAILQLLNNKASFLLSFGFHEESYFVSLGMFVWLFMVSLDPFLRIIMNWNSRRNELQADIYAVQLGFGLSMESALIRSHAENLDTIFYSEVEKWVFNTHPPLQERLAAVKSAMSTDAGLMQNAERNKVELKEIKLDVSVSTIDDESAQSQGAVL